MPLRDSAHFDTGRTDNMEGRFLRGIVVEDEDPKKIQRIRVRVRDLHKGYSDEDLPWALPACKFYGSGKEQGSIYIPAKGTEVYVMVDDQDGYNLFYFGGTATEDKIIQELVGEDYPFCYGHINRAGDLFLINTKRDIRQTYYNNGTAIMIDGSGHMAIFVADNKVSPDGEERYPAGLTFHVVGDIKILATGSVITQGRITHLQPGGLSPEKLEARQRPQEEDPSGKEDL